MTPLHKRMVRIETLMVESGLRWVRIQELAIKRADERGDYCIAVTPATSPFRGIGMDNHD